MVEGLVIALAAVALFVLTYLVGKSTGSGELEGQDLKEVEYDEEDVEPSTVIQDLPTMRVDGIDEDGRTAEEIEADLKKKLGDFDPDH